MRVLAHKKAAVLNGVDGEPGSRRLTPRNVAALCRYVLLRLRYRRLRTGPFFVDRGCDVRISSRATVRIGYGVRFMRDCTVHLDGNVAIGANVFFNRGCYIAARDGLAIGDNCLFGEWVSIHDENHVTGRGFEPISSRGFTTAPIAIGHNIWVGAKATILQGVRIGDNAVIGANAVVTHDVPANTVVAGIPARVIRPVDGVVSIGQPHPNQPQAGD